MAQSSNYKQYNRTTRVLTEESGFAGGMLWTGNNIDETHLKAIVNCDYDDTTGYLKTRDPFTPTDYCPFEGDFENAELNLDDKPLLGVYTICSFIEVSSNPVGGGPGITDITQRNAGQLYIFAKTKNENGITYCAMDDIVCVYYDFQKYYKCYLDLTSGITLKNIIPKNILVNYDNQLYGLGSDASNTNAWLNVYRLLYDSRDDVYLLKQYPQEDYVKPRIDSVTLLEAGASGFNAARCSDTFTYDSIALDAGEQPYIVGVFFKDINGDVIVSPRVGQTVTIHVPTAYISDGNVPNYLVMFQANETADTSTDLETGWTHVKTAEAIDGNFSFEFKFAKKKTTLGFTYYGSKQPSVDNPPAYSDDALDYLMPYAVVAGDNTSNLKLKSYDLTTASGSCIWRNRMCVWGVDANHNSLFLSEVDNFYYYPVPNNVALFDTNVVSCIPYKDTLLVFTADKIYRISEEKDGSFVQTVVQNDMPLSSKDSAYLTAIKNMVLFKSGNYFYMIVPKSQSLTDELSIAPIYKNIAGFLNTLDKSVQEVLQLLYPEYLFNSCIVSKSPTSVYAEQDTVHILYDVAVNISFKDNKEGIASSFKLFLNYNTNLRAWTLYIEDTGTMSLEPAMLTSARAMSFVRVHESGQHFDIVTQGDTKDTSSTFRMLLDTGYRTLSTAVQKRFREVQIKLHSKAESIAAFGTAFLVDGVWRRNYSKLQETIIDDNKVSLMPAVDLNTFATELSMPIQASGQIEKASGSDAIELSSWDLDFSHFKREAPTTIRIPVSGKGFSPRFIIMAPNAAGLTVNEINWVYRSMYGR